MHQCPPLCDLPTGHNMEWTTKTAQNLDLNQAFCLCRYMHQNTRKEHTQQILSLIYNFQNVNIWNLDLHLHLSQAPRILRKQGEGQKILTIPSNISQETTQKSTDVHLEVGWCVDHSSDSTAQGICQDCWHGTQMIAVDGPRVASHPFPPESTSHQKPVHTTNKTHKWLYVCIYINVHTYIHVCVCIFICIHIYVFPWHHQTSCRVHSPTGY